MGGATARASCENRAVSGDVPEPVCQTCGKPIDPEAPGVVKAVPATGVETRGITEWTEGTGVFFHDDCFPYGSGDFKLVG